MAIYPRESNSRLSDSGSFALVMLIAFIATMALDAYAFSTLQ